MEKDFNWQNGIIDLSKPISGHNQFGGWLVYPDGTLEHKQNGYLIGANRLRNDDWILHLLEKSWVDMNDFIPAYFQAMRNAGIQHATIRFYYD